MVLQSRICRIHSRGSVSGLADAERLNEAQGDGGGIKGIARRSEAAGEGSTCSHTRGFTDPGLLHYDRSPTRLPDDNTRRVAKRQVPRNWDCVGAVTIVGNRARDKGSRRSPKLDENDMK